jgi:hypothetical protein
MSMMGREGGRLVGLVLVFLSIAILDAGITFSSDDSKINLAVSGVKMNVASGMTVTKGTLQKVSGSTLTGSNIVFTGGTLMQDNTPVILYGDSTYGSSNIFALNGGDVFDGKISSTSIQGVSVSGKNNIITGFPDFHGTNGITLQDNQTTLTLAVKNSINKNIVLNDGSVYLGDNITLGDSGRINGAGSLIFNGYRASLGGRSSAWTGTVRLVRASDIALNSDLRIAGQMIFDGDATVNGNGNALDLTLGGTIRIKANSTVSFSNVKIKGLHRNGLISGSSTGGNIVFDAVSSSLHLDQSELELNSDYTFTTGGIYVESATHFMVKNKFIYFDRYSTLTVDGTTLTYEPLAYEDQANIVVTRNPNSGRTSTLTQLNSGSVRALRTVPTQYTYNADVTLGLHIVLSPAKTMTISNNVVLNGNYYFIYFGRANSTPLITVAAGKTLHFQNIVLMNFSPRHIQLGDGAQVIFGNNTTIEFAANETMPTASNSVTNLRFQGNGVLNGKGQYLDLVDTASITVAGHNSALLIDNLAIKGLRGTMLRTMDSTSTISLKDVSLKLSNNYTFTQGHLEMLGDTMIKGEKIFSFESPQTSTIYSRTMLTVDRNTTFSYSPHGSTRKDLVWMVDPTSVMFFNGATLKTTTTGMRIKRGTLLVDGKTDFYNTGASKLSEAIVFGNGAPAEDATISIMPGASINLQSGLIDYRNAS